ncbi:MAG: hypothetical protein KBT10_02975 [Bacteroidales bacterium]|nr:hypothetical protein [Candidatus Sodaliphilus aphodohippi]
MEPRTQSLDGSADNPLLSFSEGTGCTPPTNIAAGSRYLVSSIAASQGGGLQPQVEEDPVLPPPLSVGVAVGRGSLFAAPASPTYRCFILIH